MSSCDTCLFINAKCRAIDPPDEGQACSWWVSKDSVQPAFRRGGWVRRTATGEIYQITDVLLDDLVAVLLPTQKADHIPVVWLELALCHDKNNVPLFKGDDVYIEDVCGDRVRKLDGVKKDGSLDLINECCINHIMPSNVILYRRKEPDHEPVL